MSDKRKKLKADTQRERRRLERLAEDGGLRNEVELPAGAVLADPSQQVRNENSYDPPPLYYLDREFTCVDCGKKEVWSAQQQKWYYEVAKGSLYATATRCRKCRRERRERQGHGDPNPIKHLGSLMKRIRNGIEPSLIEAGFAFDGRRWGTELRTAWLAYARPGLTLQCLFNGHKGGLIAETMDDKTECRLIAKIGLSGSASGLLERVDDFICAVREYVRALPVPTSASGKLAT